MKANEAIETKNKVERKLKELEKKLSLEKQNYEELQVLLHAVFPWQTSDQDKQSEFQELFEIY